MIAGMASYSAATSRGGEAGQYIPRGHAILVLALTAADLALVGAFTSSRSVTRLSDRPHGSRYSRAEQVSRPGALCYLYNCGLLNGRLAAR